MGYYISPRFLDKIAVHITKNFLDIPGVRVPLILGIHGRKGEGKTFQCELVFEQMGIEPVHISGGELESPDAGDPARLIRLRYREAAEYVKVRGQMCVVIINDLDAGAGRFDSGTQYTVNTQLVNVTLMNIADNPTNVQLPGSYDETPLQRIPILVTGNDFSTLYAPLIREGRMEKFYWQPDRSDRIGIVSGIFTADGLSEAAITKLVDTFPGQAIDFYSALRSQLYDEEVRRFIHSVGIDKISQRVVNSRDGKPAFPNPNFSLEHLIEAGQRMVAEQRRVQEMQLTREYNRALWQADTGNAAKSNDFRAEPQGRQRFNGKATGQTSEVEASPIAVATPPHETTPVSDNAQPPVTNPVGTRLDPSVTAQVEHIVTSGYRLGLEYVDRRRFRTGSWQSYPIEQPHTTQEAIATLERCIRQHTNHYVRLLGIHPANKRRLIETVVHRPG